MSTTSKKKTSSTKKSLADKSLEVKKTTDKRGGSNRIGMTNQAIRKITQRGGMCRVHPIIFPDSEKFSEALLQKMLRYAVLFTQHDKLKTLSAEHVLKSLRLMGVTLLGYSDLHSAAGVTDKKKTKKDDKKTKKASA